MQASASRLEITVHGVCIHVGRVEGEVQLVCVPSSLVRSTRFVSEEHLHYWAVLLLVRGSRRAAIEGQGLGLGGVE
jgi:hypothetical protein